MITKKAKLAIILATVILLLLLALSWLFTHSFLEITVSNGSSGVFNYSLTNQSTNKVDKFDSANTHIKRLVSKGTYEIRAQRGNQSVILVKKTSGFLATEKTSVILKTEKSRQFVGNNALPCTDYLSGQLISYECGDYFSTANIHVPASNQQPTYVVKNPNTTVNGTIEGTISLDGNDYILLRGFKGDEEDSQDTGHTLYKVGPALQTQSQLKLSELKPSANYIIKSYGQGYVVYDTSFTELYYYSTLAAAGIRVPITQPKDNSLRVRSIQVTENIVTVVFSDDEGGQDEPSKKGTFKTVVSLYNIITSKVESYDFNDSYEKIQPCGPSKLCLLKSGLLEIFDTQQQTATLHGSLTGITTMSSNGNEALVTTKSGIVSFNTEALEGYYSYSFGKYRYCGQQPSGKVLILCQQTPKNDKISLLIDPSQEDTDSIDQKILLLMADKLVEDTSVYGQYIYTTLHVGDRVYDNTSNTFRYDKATQRRADQKLQEIIKKSGIDTSRYTVINTTL